jgi:RecA/RadA recombinase
VDKAKDMRPLIERRAELDSTKKDEMMAIVIRNAEAYDAVSEILTVKHVRQISEGHALVWRVVRAFHAKHNALPPRGSLVADLHNALKENAGLLTDDEKLELDDFLDYAYDLAEHGEMLEQSKKHVRVAMDTCRQFLEEHAIVDLRDVVLKEDGFALDMPGILQRKQAELDVIGTLTDGELEQPFPHGWDTREAVKLFTTGCPTLDDLMDGGWRASEVILFLGPYGSCKTTLAVHSTANLIKYAAAEFASDRTLGPDMQKRRPVVVLIFTEGEKHDYRLRLLSNLAQVPWKTLLHMSSIEELCKKKKVACTDKTRYEAKEFAEQAAAGGEGFIPEYYRVKEAIALCNQFLVLLDCTNSEDNQRAMGTGGVPEIANFVNAHFREHKDTYPLAFWLDHASALVDRMAEAGGMEVDKMMHLMLKRIPRQFKDKVAKKWRAPVGILHQLSGEANARSILADLSHADAAGSKQIGEYVDFSFVANKPDSDQMSRIRATKSRRTPPTTQRVVYVDGAFQRLTDRTADHVIDRGRIFSKTDLECFVLKTEAKQGLPEYPQHGFNFG